MKSQALTRRQFMRSGACLAAAGAVGIVAAPVASALPPGLPPTSKYSADILTGWVRFVYSQVKAERFSPTSAARAYAYVTLAAYEAVVPGMPRHRSLGGQLNDLPAIVAKRGLNWAVALNEAVGIAAQAAFADRSVAARTALADYASTNAVALAAGLPRTVLDKSLKHGRTVGDAIAARSRRDNYAETRGLPYTPPVGPDKWGPTPPNFGAALEPYWGQIRSFTLVTNNECRPARPVPYSEAEGSPFWQQAKATHDAVNTLDDNRRNLALFWRDNPDGSTGLPSGHWLLIACQLTEQLSKNLADAAEALVLTGLSLADGFTSCWTEKYESNLLRPVTYINRLIDPNWASFVNSPAFPEYTSGHSVGSAAAAETLTTLFGQVGFTDQSGMVNGYPAVSYSSIWEAANEAAMSRLYGGIHYPMGIEAGLDQGRAVSHKVLSRALTRK